VSARPKGRRRKGAGAGAHADERWLLTYSDMITLLMALFIIMWAISSVNISKFDQLKASLRSAFSGKVLPDNTSVLQGQQAPFEQDGAPIQPINQPNSQPVLQIQSLTAQISQSISQAAGQQDQQNLQRIAQQVRTYAKAHGFANDVKETIDERGLVVRLLTDKVLFASGQAVLQPRAYPLLNEISGLLAAPGIPNDVRVEGNTDDVPIHSARFPSNWELSSARANAVLEFLLAHGVQAPRLSSAGYGAENPIASNATDAGRATNRRVEIVILRRSKGASSS
jgi:chemotaxis protein MotB